jgi:autophagy-related protein 2
VNLDMIRLQVRCPPPPLRTPRSGAVIIDLHGVSLTNGARSEQIPSTRFANVAFSPSPPASRAQGLSGSVALLTADCQRVVFASSLLEEEIASVMLSLGSLSSMDETVPDSSRFGSSPSFPVTKSTALPLPLRMLVNRIESANKPSSGHPTSGTVVVTIDIPSVYADVSKPLLDGLQLWADDVSQLVERIFGVAGETTDTERAESRTPSLIGSRFFAKSRRYGSKSSVESSAGLSGPPADMPSESVVKIAVSEGSVIKFSQTLIPNKPCVVHVVLKLPREENVSSVRPFNIVASDVDVLIELKPEGQVSRIIF